MSHLTRQELERLAVGQGGSHGTSRHQSGSATFQPPPAPRDVRRDIYNAVYSAGRAVSRAEIAKALGVKKTPWLCEHVERLVREGYLLRIGGMGKNGAPMFYYEVAQ